MEKFPDTTVAILLRDTIVRNLAFRMVFEKKIDNARIGQHHMTVCMFGVSWSLDGHCLCGPIVLVWRCWRDTSIQLSKYSVEESSDSVDPQNTFRWSCQRRSASEIF